MRIVGDEMRIGIKIETIFGVEIKVTRSKPRETRSRSVERSTEQMTDVRRREAMGGSRKMGGEEGGDGDAEGGAGHRRGEQRGERGCKVLLAARGCTGRAVAPERGGHEEERGGLVGSGAAVGPRGGHAVIAGHHQERGER